MTDAFLDPSTYIANGPASPIEDPAARLAMVVDLVREISVQTDPQEMVAVFRKRVPKLYHGDASISVSRRGLASPWYRITRSTRWTDNINPWKQRERLPLLEGGLLAELLYGDQPRIVRDVSVAPDDPAYEYIGQARALVVLPLYDGGAALNMVIRLSLDPHGFDDVQLHAEVLQANLFGRATSSLLLAQKLQRAYAELDRELAQVGDLQRALLPARLPRVDRLDIAVSYKTAARAGGDYYDFFDLHDGRWGVLIADVSGHGTRAAVVMAMLRTMLHGRSFDLTRPSEVLAQANQRLGVEANRYDGMFVTAFYGVFCPKDGSLRYACAGHNPPLLVNKAIRVSELDQAQALPLAVEPEVTFPEGSTTLASGDTLLLYTDGITEAMNARGEYYGRERLLSCVREDVPNAQHIIDCVVHKLLAFTDGGTPHDDQTLLALRVE